MPKLTADDICAVVISERMSGLALSIAKLYSSYHNDRPGFETGESYKDAYERNNYCAVLAEFAVSHKLLGGILPAVLARNAGLLAAREYGRPVDNGVDLRLDVRSGLRLDVKSRRQRDSDENPLCLTLIVPASEFKGRADDHCYVLVSVDSPDDGLEYMSERDWKVRILGWCRRDELELEEYGMFAGKYVRKAKDLHPIRDLETEGLLVKS